MILVFIGCKDGVLERLYQTSNNITQEFAKHNDKLANLSFNQFLENLNKPENKKKKVFFTEMLEILNTFEIALKRKERHLHVAAARMMEGINLLNENKYLIYFNKRIFIV